MSDTRNRINSAGSEGDKQLSFPLDYETTSGHWLVLSEFEYSRSSGSLNAKAQSTGLTVRLPIPRNLNSTYTARWGEENVGALLSTAQKYVNNIDLNSVTGSASDTQGNWVNNLIGQAKVIGADMAKAAIVDVATNVPGSQQALGLFGGMARNPFVAVLFEGVDLRSFVFDYHFFPQSKKEFIELEKIIKALKYGMHPSYAGGNLSNFLFKYPNMYLPSFTKSDHLFTFGFCVITGVHVDYHGEGIPLYIDDGGKKIPASIKLSFTIKEIEVVTKETIDSGVATKQGLGDTLTTRTITNSDGSTKSTTETGR